METVSMCVQECRLDVHLFQLVVVVCGDGEYDLLDHGLNNGGKCPVVVGAETLLEALDNPPGLMLYDRTVRASFVAIDP